MKRLPVILIPVFILVLAVTAAGRGRRPAAISTEDAAKADYMYLEALRAKSQGNYDAAFSLLSRARELNPSDLETGLELSNFLLIMSSEPTDTGGMARGVEMLRSYWDANPSD